MFLVYSLLSILLVYAAYIDIRQHRIANRFCALVAALGLIGNSFLPSGAGFYACLIGLSAGLLPMLLIHLLTGLGAGDVKLMAAIGSVVGFKSILIILYCSFLISGTIALCYLLFKGGVADILRRYGRFFSFFLKGKIIFSKPATGTPSALQLPLAPGIAIASAYELLPKIAMIIGSDMSFWK